MQPTIRDVARHAQTSVSTVSRVLTGDGPVAAETRARIEAAIRALGYQPNALARGLVQKRTGTVGVVIPDVANPFFAEVLRGMGDHAGEQGVQLLLVNADLSMQKEAEGLALLREKQVDGVIYASGMVTDEHRELFRRFGRPVVLAATHDPREEIPGVLVDSRRGASIAMEFLIGLGHRRIAVLNGPRNDLVSGLPRWEGYQQAALGHGLDLDPTLCPEGDYRLESGYRELERILDRSDPPPTAVLAASDLMAIGAMNAAIDRGFRVPDDISVVGFDNIALARAVRPALTTVAQPMYAIGVRAAALMVQAIGGQTPYGTDWIQPFLEVRRSAAAPPA